MADQTVYNQQRDKIRELMEAVQMAHNRLEAALIGPEVCRNCVEVAKSYLDPFTGIETN
jgi:hypothetical protein